MRLLLRIGLLLALLGAMVGLYRWSPYLVEHLLFPPPTPTRGETREDLQAVERAHQLIHTSLPAAGLSALEPVEERWEERTESTGASWEVWETTWRLPEHLDPLPVARRIRSLVEGGMDRAEVYLVTTETLTVEVRVYAASRLAAFLTLVPTLPEWPQVAPAQSPLLSIVLRDAREAPRRLRGLYEYHQPFSVALSPYSPFTLRLARDAVTEHKEVLVLHREDGPFEELLAAVPHASGILLEAVPDLEPRPQAASLQRADAYVLDMTPQGLPATWIRALRAEGVSFIRGHAWDDTEPETTQRRFRHGAARDGAAILVVPLTEPTVEEILATLTVAQERGYRPSFAAEVADRLDPRTD